MPWLELPGVRRRRKEIEWEKGGGGNPRTGSEMQKSFVMQMTGEDLALRRISGGDIG